MRRFLPLLLLAAATPALAAADPEAAEPAPKRELRSDSDRPFMSRVERIERASRSEHAEQRAAAPEPVAERPRRSERRQRTEAPVIGGSDGAVARRERGEGRERWSAPAAEDRSTIGDSVREWRWRERNAERERRSGDVAAAPQSPVMGDVLPTPRSVTREVAPAAQGERRMGNVLRNRIATEGWRREWREDRRFDWRRHRSRHWDRFNLGIYIDPFGWNYRRWQLGWRLPSRHYARSFWIHDPWYYSLPPVYGPYRWVRYWDDALLVDLRTGRVVDVIHNFFW